MMRYYLIILFLAFSFSFFLLFNVLDSYLKGRLPNRHYNEISKCYRCYPTCLNVQIVKIFNCRPWGSKTRTKQKGKILKHVNFIVSLQTAVRIGIYTVIESFERNCQQISVAVDCSGHGDVQVVVNNSGRSNQGSLARN